MKVKPASDASGATRACIVRPSENNTMEEDYIDNDSEAVMEELLPPVGDASFVGICKAMTKPHLTGAAAKMLEGFGIESSDKATNQKILRA
jgi:hypothetical protein